MTDNYKKIGESIVETVGLENIESITHCATRLRLEVSDRNQIDDKKIENIDQVKGVFFNSGQYQIILGTGVVNKVYEQIMLEFDQLQNKKTNVDTLKEKNSNAIQKFIRNISDVFLPIIPGIVATGLFMGLKGVILNETILSWFGLSASMIPVELTTFISILTDTVFQFLPALITWSAFKKFGGSPIIGFVAGSILAPR